MCIIVADGGEVVNAGTENMPKIEILPSSDFSKLSNPTDPI